MEEARLYVPREEGDSRLISVEYFEELAKIDIASCVGHSENSFKSCTSNSRR